MLVSKDEEGLDEGGHSRGQDRLYNVITKDPQYVSGIRQ